MVMLATWSFAHAPWRWTFVRCFATNLGPRSRPLSSSLVNLRCLKLHPRLNHHCKCWTVRRFPSLKSCSFWLNFPTTFSDRSCFSTFVASWQTNCKFACRLDLKWENLRWWETKSKSARPSTHPFQLREFSSLRDSDKDSRVFARASLSKVF